MGTTHSMKEVLIAEEGSVIKVYELQHLNKRGKRYKKKKAGDSIKTYLNYYTF
jgi:hypothetical protein